MDRNIEVIPSGPPMGQGHREPLEQENSLKRPCEQRVDCHYFVVERLLNAIFGTPSNTFISGRRFHRN